MEEKINYISAKQTAHPGRSLFRGGEVGDVEGSGMTRTGRTDKQIAVRVTRHLSL